MPRMSKKRRLEWAFFLNERNRITFNALCRGCTHDCKQSFRAIVVLCPRYYSKRWKARPADKENQDYVEHTQLADACLATCSFDTENKYEVTAILCEKQTLYFENKNGIITFNFEISGLTGPTRTLYVHSILRDPGLTLRIEQNHIGRRAGKYREGDYPATEILAANHYMFAMREMLYALDLPQYLNRNRLGYLLILGFETNNEIHTDYPPHWHLIYRWPNHAGSPAPHIYLAPDGKMTENACYVDCAHGTHRDYSAGEWCPFVDPYGHDVCAIRINADGGMSITKPMSSIYTMSAYTPDVGVTIYKDDTLIGTIRTENDTDQGIFNVTWNSTGNLNFHGSYSETIEYNTLTGAILKIKR